MTFKSNRSFQFKRLMIGLILLVGCFAMLIKGCSFSENNKELSAMQGGLKAYLEKRIPGSDFMIHYHIGSSFSGETDFRLRGDGAYELWSTVTEGRQRRTYSGQLSVSQVEQVVQELLAAEIWKAKHVFDKPKLDDPEASITVKVDSQTFQVALWVSEIRENPSFVRAQQGLLALIHHISGGEVLEGGK